MAANAGSEGKKTDVTGSDAEGEENQPQTVAYDTYQKVLDQRKADRARARELEAELATVKAKQAEADEKALADQKKFEELYTKEKGERAKLQETVQSMTQRQVENAKREAIKAALGGVRKDDYAKFFDLSAVQLNEDGSVDPESVKVAANKFRESYPELVAGKQSAKIANEAGTSHSGGQPKPLHQMSEAELRARLAAVSAKK